MMTRYFVYSGRLKESKTKGELPDIIYEYIANDSMIHWHFSFTKDIENVYVFDDIQEAKEVASLLNMNVKEVW